jgi:hypothetical protein
VRFFVRALVWCFGLGDLRRPDLRRGAHADVTLRCRGCSGLFIVRGEASVNALVSFPVLSIEQKVKAAVGADNRLGHRRARIERRKRRP